MGILEAFILFLFIMIGILIFRLVQMAIKLERLEHNLRRQDEYDTDLRKKYWAMHTELREFIDFLGYVKKSKGFEPDNQWEKKSCASVKK